MLNLIVGRIMMMFGFMIFMALFTFQAFASEMMVFNVHRNIPLSDDEPVFQDFYINAGEEAGLKKDLVVNVVRKITMRDAVGLQSFGELLIPVGQLRVLFASQKLSVARLYKSFSKEDHPLLDQEGVMTGDKIDLKGAFTDKRKIKPIIRKIAEAPTVELPKAVPVPLAPAAVVVAAPNKMDIKPGVEVKDSASSAAISESPAVAPTAEKPQTKESLPEKTTKAGLEETSVQ